METFFQKLDRRWNDGARMWVGLDPALEDLPQKFRSMGKRGQLSFCRDIINRTWRRTLFYKANLWFYRGDLIKTLVEIGNIIPTDVPFIIDAKIGDIGRTSKEAAALIFNEIHADGVTLNPYVGKKALEPFLAYEDRGLFFLCRTSNEGADEFQNLEVRVPLGDATTRITPLYEHVARRIAEKWNVAGNCGLVVGATAPEELARIRTIVPDLWILAPGIGTQGGDIENAILHGARSDSSGIALGSASSIIFADKPGHELGRLTTAVNQALRKRARSGCGVG